MLWPHGEWRAVDPTAGRARISTAQRWQSQCRPQHLNLIPVTTLGHAGVENTATHRHVMLQWARCSANSIFGLPPIDPRTHTSPQTSPLHFCAVYAVRVLWAPRRAEHVSSHVATATWLRWRAVAARLAHGRPHARFDC